MVFLVKAELTHVKLGQAICLVQDITKLLCVSQRNVLLTLQCCLQVITNETSLCTLFPHDILHAQFVPLFEVLHQLSTVL